MKGNTHKKGYLHMNVPRHQTRAGNGVTETEERKKKKGHHTE